MTRKYAKWRLLVKGPDILSPASTKAPLIKSIKVIAKVYKTKKGRALLMADLDKRGVLKINAAIGRMLKLTACKIVPDIKTCKEVMIKIIQKTK
jgi:hypothetical protein